MVKATELRLGNYVLFGNYAKYRYNGKAVLIVEKEDFLHVDFDDAEPIELTPEILKHCTFHDTNHIYCGVDENRNILLYFHDDSETVILRELKSLHQLQNLYYSLTGEELAVNIPQTV